MAVNRTLNGRGIQFFVVFLVLSVLSVCLASQNLSAQETSAAIADEPTRVDLAPPLEVRIGLEQLRNPFWYETHGQPEEARYFWDRRHWEGVLRQWASDGYNGLIYWVEPWTETHWKHFLIRHAEFPDAADLSPEETDRVIEHVNWIFTTAHEVGLKNYLFDYHVVTTKTFAQAHGMAREMEVSETVDWRHNLKDHMGAAYGVRNEQTRAFTEAAIAELFQTYENLDGLIGQMGEALPGKRSTWFREAVVPGLKRSGRRPVYNFMNWMTPFDEFMADIAPPEVYDNTWITVLANGEMFTDAKPYPAAVRWAERSGLPTVFEIAQHNVGDGLPFNSPRLAHEIVHEYRKVENCKGFLAWILRYDPNHLYRKALGYYGKNDVPYSPDPWVELLEAQFGDREAAEHFLRAYDASARITPELTAIAWCPMDRGVSQQLVLPYWYWTEQDPRWGGMVSPSRAGVLLPPRHYAKVVARFGEGYRDNNGSDFSKNREHPGAQEMIWGLGYYPTTPEEHMRNIRRLGDEALREAEAAIKTVKSNHEQAMKVYHSMKAYQLLSDYYERKVLAAISALIVGFGGDEAHKAEALELADQAVDRYETAISYIWEHIDKKSGNMKGRWGGEFTLPELIEREKQERDELARLFNWPDAQAETDPAQREHRDQIGADWRE